MVDWGAEDKNRDSLLSLDESIVDGTGSCDRRPRETREETFTGDQQARKMK